ncbi:MAG: peptidoglycan-binding protein, partial [Christensenella sp.]|uniref:peptidoglycan-binding protein n=1 Tax=Christensenella sp. TaxID=1935934 RepID=UPI002B1F568E
MKKKYFKKRNNFSSYRVKNLFKDFFSNIAKWSKTKKIALYAGTAAVAVAVVVVVLSVNGGLPTMAFGSDDQQAVASQGAEGVQAAEPTPDPTPEPTPEPTPDPTLKEGMESEEVAKLQQRLMDLGFLQIDETTNYFGPATNLAVQYFQRQQGLEQDGVAGPLTLAQIYSEDAKPYTLLQGTEGEDVQSLQSRLQELGYLGTVSGYYGTDTIAAVKAFQSRNDLGVDGKTGEMTLNLIYSPDAEPTEEMKNAVQRKGNIDAFINSAAEKLGCKYVWGAQGPNTFDCSGLVTYCLRAAGSTTGRYNAAGFSQNSEWEKISFDNL